MGHVSLSEFLWGGAKRMKEMGEPRRTGSNQKVRVKIFHSGHGHVGQRVWATFLFLSFCGLGQKE